MRIRTDGKSRSGRSSQCRVCTHRESAAIDLSLARGVSKRALARRYHVSVHSLYRHSASHLSPALRAKLIAGPTLDSVDLDALRNTESQSLLMNLRLLSALDVAEENGDSAMVARVANQLHSNLEITASLEISRPAARP